MPPAAKNKKKTRPSDTTCRHGGWWPRDAASKTPPLVDARGLGGVAAQGASNGPPKDSVVRPTATDHPGGRIGGRQVEGAPCPAVAPPPPHGQIMGTRMSPSPPMAGRASTLVAGRRLGRVPEADCGAAPVAARPPLDSLPLAVVQHPRRSVPSPAPTHSIPHLARASAGEAQPPSYGRAMEGGGGGARGVGPSV